MGLIIPEKYDCRMSVRETERAIKFVKDAFQRNFVRNFGFERVSAPLFVESRSGVNDDLNGVERAVRFDISAQGGRDPSQNGRGSPSPVTDSATAKGCTPT